LAAVRQAFPGAPIIIGRNEAHLLSDAEENLSAKYGFPITAPMADQLVDDGQRLEIAGLSFLVREIPGHSPGSVVYILDQFSPMVVLGGDVLFAGSIGRTDLGGSFATLARGIRSKLFVLPDDAVVLSGHGPETTVGEEKRNNPFVGDASSYVPN
jgi:hydroxyacylglutathione hydrolase